MATKAAKTAEPEGFGPSPFPFADTIKKEQEQREIARREELRKQRKMTNPQHAENMEGRPNRLRLPKAFVKSLDERGLMAGWIRKDEWDEYRERGCKVVTHEDIAKATGGQGVIEGDPNRDPKMSPTGAVERAEMLLIMQPKKWHEDRMLQEQHMARTQMHEDPFDELKGAQRAGHFGKGSRRPDALVFEDDED